MSRILITNDDGFRAHGLLSLAQALEGLGEVWVVAPDREASAAGHSLTLHRPLRIEEVSARRFVIDGTPTDCVYIGVHRLMKEKPDLVISGINRGGNLGDDVTYSGTVCAALEGVIAGIPSFAISLVVKNGNHFDTAALFAARLALQILERGLPSQTFLNVNVPDLHGKEIKGWKVTCLGKRLYGGDVVEGDDPRGKRYFWIGGDQGRFADIAGSDCNAVMEGYISVTPLQTDLTSFPFMEELSRWEPL